MLHLKRIAPGYYKSRVYPIEIGSWVRPEADGYGPAGERQWYWRYTDRDADNVFDTKWQAVEAAKATLKSRQT